MNGFELIDYNNCITNLANSILKKFDVETGDGSSLPIADEYLKKDYKNAVILLLDALGMNIIEKNLEKDSFFNKKLLTEHISVYPPTTVPATTAILSGKNPLETHFNSLKNFFNKRRTISNPSVFL